MTVRVNWPAGAEAAGAVTLKPYEIGPSIFVHGTEYAFGLPSVRPVEEAMLIVVPAGSG